MEATASAAPTSGAPTMTLKIQDAAGEIHEIGYEIIRECALFMDAVAYTDTSEPCKLENISPEMLKVIFDFSKLFKDEPEYEPVEDSTKGPAPDDDSPGMLFFSKMDNKYILKIIKANDYLNNKRMMDYIIWHICKQVRGSSAEKMRWFFELKDADPIDVTAKKAKEEAQDFDE